MTPAPSPDVEAVLVAYLLDRAELAASAGRISTVLASELPAIRLGVISMTTPTARRLDASSVQVEAWAADRIAARDLAAAARAVLLDDTATGPVGVWAGLGVITAVEEGLGLRPLPDPETETPRWVFTVAVYAHP